MNSSIIATVVPVDRSSTGTRGSPVIPADDDDSIGNVGDTDGTIRLSARAPQLSPLSVALGSAPSLKADADASLEMSASAPSATATPDLNWLIELGEC